MMFLAPLLLIGLFGYTAIRREKAQEALTKALGLDDL